MRSEEFPTFTPILEKLNPYLVSLVHENQSFLVAM